MVVRGRRGRPALLLVVALLLVAAAAGCGSRVASSAGGHVTGAGGASPPASGPQGAWSFVSAPDLHPASITVTRDTGKAAPGYIFVTPGNASYGDTGPLIMDGKGQPVWVGHVPAGQNAGDLRVQSYQGKPVLTWWQGKIIKPGYGVGINVIADTSYRRIATVRPGPGLTADIHDFTITPQGTALITAYTVVPYDLSALGGSRNGQVLDSLVEEVDIATGKVLLRWDPLTQIPLDQSYMKPAPGQLFDPYHVNSVSLDKDGNLLISLRHTWTVYKVDRHSGRIMWRLGGKRSDFTLGPGARFAWQHAALRMSDGALAVFDNASAGTAKEADVSRGLVLNVNEATKMVTVAHQYSQPGVLATSQGNIQPLPNGSFFIGWGAAPALSEYTRAGALVWNARFYQTNQSYRAFKFPWHGQPATKPAVVAQASAGGDATVAMSWNGATGAASWQVMAGPTARSLHVVATVPRRGFETVVKTKRQAWFAVRALAAGGRPLATSVAVRIAALPVAPVSSATASASPSP